MSGLPSTFTEQVVTASPTAFLALHMYVPESSAYAYKMSRATNPKSYVVLKRWPTKPRYLLTNCSKTSLKNLPKEENTHVKKKILSSSYISVAYSSLKIKLLYNKL